MKRQYELTGNVGGDSELGAEKRHIGGYGGEKSFLARLGSMVKRPFTFGGDIRIPRRTLKSAKRI